MVRELLLGWSGHAAGRGSLFWALDQLRAEARITRRLFRSQLGLFLAGWGLLSRLPRFYRPVVLEKRGNA